MNANPVGRFFWFFESRKDPHNAPLSIWLNGGPGGSSLMGALSENGPCFVGRDSNSTYLNPWSWSVLSFSEKNKLDPGYYQRSKLAYKRNKADDLASLRPKYLLV